MSEEDSNNPPPPPPGMAPPAPPGMDAPPPPPAPPGMDAPPPPPAPPGMDAPPPPPAPPGMDAPPPAPAPPGMDAPPPGLEMPEEESEVDSDNLSSATDLLGSLSLESDDSGDGAEEEADALLDSAAASLNLIEISDEEASGEEPTEETPEMPEETIEDKPMGLMSRRNM